MDAQDEKDWRWLVTNGRQQILDEVPKADFYVHRRFEKDEILPWEMIDLRIKRSLLEREYERALEQDVGPLIERAKKQQMQELG